MAERRTSYYVGCYELSLKDWRVRIPARWRRRGESIVYLRWDPERGVVLVSHSKRALSEADFL